MCHINIQYQKAQPTVKRKINEITIAQFKLNLSYDYQIPKDEKLIWV